MKLIALPSVVDAPIVRFRDNPLNPRKVYDLSNLKPSIARDGVLQAIGAVADGDVLYPIWGNRRLLCCRELGIETIPCRVFPGPLEPGKAEWFTVLENSAREDLLPSEQAAAYKAALDAGGLKLTELAEMLGRSPGHVSKALAVLKLAPPLVALIDRGLLPATSAPDLAKLSEAAQRKKAETITSRQTRQELERSLGKSDGGRGRPSNKLHRLRRGRLRLLYTSDDLPSLLAEVEEIRKQINRALSENWDFATLARVLSRNGANP